MNNFQNFFRTFQKQCLQWEVTWGLLPRMEFVGLAKLGFVTSPVGIISPWSQRPEICENSQVGWRTDLIMPARRAIEDLFIISVIDYLVSRH